MAASYQEAGMLGVFDYLRGGLAGQKEEVLSELPDKDPATPDPSQVDPALVAGLEVGGLQLAEQGLDADEVILRMGSLSLGENSELSKATQEDIKEATERARGKLSDLILSLGEDPSGWTGNTILNDEYKLELILG